MVFPSQIAVNDDMLCNIFTELYYSDKLRTRQEWFVAAQMTQA